jgi:hypothetical protein
MSDFCTEAITNFASKDTNRIVGKIAEVLAQRSPWMDILEGGTLENVSDVVRSIVQEQAVMANSLARPSFTNDTELCGSSGTPDQVGTTEYSYQLQSLRGEGPKVCVKQGRTSFKGSYIQAQMALEKGILKLTNADIRYQLYNRSGVKFTVRSDKNFDQLINGDSQDIDTSFVNLEPNAPLSFKTLYRLCTVLREELLADPFESDSGVMFKFIGSIDQIELFRNELDIKEDLRALTTGRYQLGEKSLTGYQWSGPYRGVAFGIDQQPLRAMSMTAGQPNLLEPEVSVVASKGVAARRNPDWINANFEVGFLIAAQSFKRLVPQQWVGEGTFKFAPQLHAGELKWHYAIDNACNKYGDFGQHIYQISRAYQPIRPHAIIPIVYQRCGRDLGLTQCSTSVSGL